MLATHYALAALARELTRPVAGGGLVGAVLVDAFSQQPGEIRLVFAVDGPAPTVRALVIGTKPPAVFPAAEASRPRRNVATRFEAWHGRRVEAVRVSDGDRLLTVALGGDAEIVAVLFGPRANVVVTEAETLPESPSRTEPPRTERVVADAFLAPALRVGTPAPVARAAVLPATAEAFARRLSATGTDAARVRRAWPLFDDLLATEALARAAASLGAPAAASIAPDPFDAPAALFAASQSVHADALAAPSPSVVWRGAVPVAVSLVPLSPGVAERIAEAVLGEATQGEAPASSGEGGDAGGEHDAGRVRVEAFGSVGEALAVFARRRFARVAFARRRAALADRLDGAIDQGRERVERMLTEMSRPSRADDAEAEAHLLLAQLDAVPPGADRVTLPDLLDGGAPREIRLDPSLSAAANAAERYARARRLRAARAHAESRLVAADAALTEATRLREALNAARDVAAIDRFARDAEDALARLAPARVAADERLPYHRVPLAAGYEAWIARSAADGDALTLRHARPFDLWLHARGVAGAHVVVRLRGRHDVPPKAVVERAAALAAFASKARTSALAPVTVTPRKWVRKRKGALPGQVTVEREEVLIVAPRGPDA